MSPDLHVDIKRRKPIESVEEEVFLNLLRTANQLHGPPMRLMKDHGLTSQQYNVLRILSGAPTSGLTCAEVRDRMITRVPDVTRLVDRMIDAGLVVRERCSSDRRVVRVTVSPEGRRLARKLAPELIDLHKDMMAHVDVDDLILLNKLLSELRGNEPQEHVGDR